MKLILDKVTQKFPGRKIFHDISIEVEKGEKLVITGPNGSGKTTLAKIIGSLIRPSSGLVKVEIGGKTICGSEIISHIGLVAPDLFLYDELTGAENIAFFTSVIDGQTENTASLFGRYGLEGRENDLVRSYSSGMKQRLKYILAMLRKPPLLILDEPTANLDEDGKDIVRDIITKHDGITVIATNEQADLGYADKTIVLGR
ncbi:MAG: ABC transporter ATP-binding protein [candidate division Zixibacteria bacterium]|jgi:heme exporter protein A|nr:ABC transporter ATP-binding protein [candidate division Zixibacteria bacterium]